VSRTTKRFNTTTPTPTWLHFGFSANCGFSGKHTKVLWDLCLDCNR